jgi:two-component system, LytTR family, response regulator
MLLKCIAIDKEFAACELITSYIESFPALKLLQTFDDVMTGGEFLRYNQVDLLFIDLSIPVDTAINLVKSIQDKILIIFTLACKQLPTEVLRLDVLDYLVKPITFERFTRAAEKAIDQHEKINPAKSHSGTIYIRSAYQLIKVDLDEIEYIESVENYIKIHLTNGKSVMTLMPLKVIIEKLPQEKFVRIHRSYIISVDKIKYIGNRKIKLNIAELPVSNSYLINLNILLKK